MAACIDARRLAGSHQRLHRHRLFTFHVVPSAPVVDRWRSPWHRAGVSDAPTADTDA